MLRRLGAAELRASTKRREPNRGRAFFIGFVDQPLTKYDEDPTWGGQVGLGLHFDVKL
jgi:hypothetical protein